MFTSLGFALTRAPMKDMLSVEDRTGGTPQQEPSGAISGKSINDGAKRYLYETKDPVRQVGMHRRHMHTSEANRQVIIEFDRRLLAHFHTHGRNAPVMPLFEELVSKPFFQRESIPLPPQWHEALNVFHMCSMDAGKEEREKHADALTEAFKTHVLKIEGHSTDNEESAERLKRVKDIAKSFLETSNRIKKPEFECHVLEQRVTILKRDERCSLQKMGLETMDAAFDAVASGEERLNMAKKLTDMLPGLEIHHYVDRSAQYRGLKLLEKWMDKMPSNDVAVVTTHLMNVTSSLSATDSYFSLPKRKGYKSAIYTGIVLTGPVAILAHSHWNETIKRPKSSALHLLRKQLTRLRYDWSVMRGENKHALKAAFNELQNNINAFGDVGEPLINRFFGDEYINPNGFPVETTKRGHVVHGLKMPIARFFQPKVTTRHDGTPASQLVNLFMEISRMPANLQNENLNAATGKPNWSVLAQRFNTAARAKHARWITTCLERVKELPAYQNAGPAQSLLLLQITHMATELAEGREEFLDKFSGVAQEASADCHNNVRQIFDQLWNAVILEYVEQKKFGFDSEEQLFAWAHDQFRREKLRGAVVAVAKERINEEARAYANILFSSKTTEVAHIDRLVSMVIETAILKYRAAQNKEVWQPIALATLKQLRIQLAQIDGSAPMLDMVECGEKFASFLKYVISCVNNEFKLRTEVEQHLAAEVALGGRLGLWDPLDAMGYANTARKTVERKNLVAIEQKTKDAASSKEDFVDFLMTLTPVTDFIRRNPACKFEENLANPLAKLALEFEKAENEFFANEGKPTFEQTFAFEEAAVVFQKARLQAEDREIRRIINTLLDRFPGVMEIKPRHRSFLMSAGKGVRLDAGIAGQTTEPLTSGQGMLDQFNTMLKILSAQRAENSAAGIMSGQASVPNPKFDPAQAVPASDMYLAPQTASGSRRIFPQDLGHVTLADNAGGGDCLFYALGVEQDGIAAFRNRVADTISKRANTPQQCSYNAQMVTAAVLQTGLSKDVPNFRQLEIPNDVYAAMVRIPGIYAGEDELRAFTQLPENAGRTVCMIDTDGVIARFRDGTREPVSYTSENFSEVLRDVLAGADIALYKTPNHWQRIQPTSQSQDSRRNTNPKF